MFPAISSQLIHISQAIIHTFQSIRQKTQLLASSNITLVPSFITQVQTYKHLLLGLLQVRPVEQESMLPTVPALDEGKCESY